MGYRGKVVEQEQARALRAQGYTMPDIATILGVSRSSVSLWTRDVDFTPQPRRPSRRLAPNKLQLLKQAQIEDCRAWGSCTVGQLSDRDLLIAGIALYAGEGSKGDGEFVFANTNPRMVALFCRWLRRFFEVDEARLRARIYLHDGLDIEAATRHWSAITGVPLSQFRSPYRAVADPSMRTAKHEFGCVYVRYGCSRTHREIMGLIDALLAD